MQPISLYDKFVIAYFAIQHILRFVLCVFLSLIIVWYFWFYDNLVRRNFHILQFFAMLSTYNSLNMFVSALYLVTFKGYLNISARDENYIFPSDKNFQQMFYLSDKTVETFGGIEKYCRKQNGFFEHLFFLLTRNRTEHYTFFQTTLSSTYR